MIHNRYISLPTQGIYGPLSHFDGTYIVTALPVVAFDFPLCILAFLNCQPLGIYLLSRSLSGIASSSLQQLHDANLKTCNVC